MIDLWLLVIEVSTLSLILLTTQIMVTTGIIPPQGKNPHGRAGNQTWYLVIRSQKLWPLDHEAAHLLNIFNECLEVFSYLR